MSVPLFSRMSVTSKSEMRYEGTLVDVNAAAATITLAQVRALGTEGRRPAGEIPPSPQVFESIIFRGSDIKELKVLAPPPAQPPYSVAQSQPVIAQHQAPVQNLPTSTLPPAPSIPPPQMSPSSSSFSYPPAQPSSVPSVQPRVAEVSRMSRLFEEPLNIEPFKKTETSNERPPSGAVKPNGTPIPASQQQPSKQPSTTSPTAMKNGNKTSTTSSPSQSKKSVFDTKSAVQTAVVTVEGLGPGTSSGQVREMFDNQNDIVSVKVMALPSGGTAADIVFTNLDAASIAIAGFSQPGVTARHLDENPREQRKFQPRMGEQRQRPPQVRGGPPQVGDQTSRPKADVKRGGDAPKKEAQIGTDFDFSASNARFEKTEIAAELATETVSSTPKSKGFFDDVSMSANLDGNVARITGQANRRKDAETFGSLAYNYRGGSQQRGGPSGRGGNFRGSDRGGRGGRGSNDLFRQRPATDNGFLNRAMKQSSNPGETQGSS